MTKFIKIEWDETYMKEEHTEGLRTLELFGILETVKLNLWEGRVPLKEESNEDTIHA